MAVGDELVIYRVAGGSDPEIIAVPVRETDVRFYPLESDHAESKWNKAFNYAKFIQKNSNMYDLNPQVALERATARARKELVRARGRYISAQAKLDALEALRPQLGLAPVRSKEVS